MGEAGVDTVVHMGVIATPKQAGGRSTMKEINVIGTMQLLAACQRTPSVRSLIVKSTAAVYGSGPKDPAKFSEDMEPKHAPSSGWAKDSVEVETYVRGFARRRPDVTVTTLRFANFIGPRVQTALTAYFTLPVVPDRARLRSAPAVRARGRRPRGHPRPPCSVPGRAPSTSPATACCMLSQALRRSRRATVAVPSLLFPSVGRAMSPRGLADFSPEAVRYLTFGRALDTRAMRRTLGFEPSWTSEGAFMAFVNRNESHQESDVA